MDCQDLTEKIIGCAYRVHNTLGFGFLEAVYEKSLAIEFSKIGVLAEFQKPIEVFYENKPVGNYVVDVLVGGKLILTW